MRTLVLGCALLLGLEGPGRCQDEPVYETQVVGEAPLEEPDRASSRVTRGRSAT